MSSLLQFASRLFVLFFVASLVSAQSSSSTASSTANTQPSGGPNSGYEGYNLTQKGSPEDTVYETASTKGNYTLNVEPDVYLNASVHVGEILIEVDDISAKINLDAQVLQLLKFNAGVDAKIGRVRLQILEVNAKVLLEARLGNLLLMISDVLDSLDLNPILATLGNDLNHLINSTGATLTGTPGPGKNGPAKVDNGNKINQKRALRLEQNVLYSVNDYSGNTHTNRILAQNGDIVEQTLDNVGKISTERVVGNYEKDMTPNGFSLPVIHDGWEADELEYEYAPFPGLSVVALIYKAREGGKVVGAQVVSEAFAGGSSTIENMARSTQT